MHDSQILNLGPGADDHAKVGTENPPGNFAQMEDMIEQTRADVRRIRTQLDRQEDHQDFYARRTKTLSIVLGALIVIFVAALWFAYPTLRDQKQAAMDMLGLQNIATALGSRMQSVEASLSKTAAGLAPLTERVDQLGASMKSGLETARSQAQAAATQAGQRIRQEFSHSIQVIQSRMAGLESNQRESSERVNQLQAQIAGLKQELASMREQSTAAAERIRQLQDEQQIGATALSSLDQKMATHQTTLDSLSSRVVRNRVDFELPNRQTQEIAPGIQLTIRRTNTGKQEIDGTLQLGANTRTMPIRAQGIQKPVVFYMANDSRPTELVFTQVEKNRVSGYVMAPDAVRTATEAGASRTPMNQ